MCASIAVAMSGGVDSSVAAWLLQEQGHTLTGITLTLFPPNTPPCPCASSQEAEDARRVAEQLNIPHNVLSLFDPFRQEVMNRFVSAYEVGRTPNPCVDCNRQIKFGALLDYVLAQKQERLATGHYARLRFEDGSGRWLLQKALHPEKDQSYVLYSLTQHQLSHSQFPLGGLSKEEIRSLAAEQGFVTARKRESQDICFIPDGDYSAFLRRYTGKTYPPGSFYSEDGQCLGSHTGIVDYTVGQRRGLGVSSNQGRLYVKEIRPAENRVILSGNQSLFSNTLEAEGLNLIACSRLSAPVRLRAKIRYRMTEQPCTVEQTGDTTVRVIFDQPQRAITPGQSVVFYDGDCVVGGAVICQIPKKEREAL